MKRDIQAEMREIFGKTEISYDEFENSLISFARERGAEFLIGEIQFGGEDVEAAHQNLKGAVKRSAEKQAVSLIWPREGLPFLEV